MGCCRNCPECGKVRIDPTRHWGFRNVADYKAHRLTEIEWIDSYDHSDVQTAISRGTPIKEGLYLVKWVGVSQHEWAPAEHIWKYGQDAVKEFFVRHDRRQKEVELMKKVVFISSLDDVRVSRIVAETDRIFRIRIIGLSDAFIEEMEHSEWSKQITPTYIVERTDGSLFIHVPILHAEYMAKQAIDAWDIRRTLGKKLPKGMEDPSFRTMLTFLAGDEDVFAMAAEEDEGEIAEECEAGMSSEAEPPVGYVEEEHCQLHDNNQTDEAKKQWKSAFQSLLG
ncbi:hypothetical protein PFISCL1PPCAC_26275, partial [Pristionchus fissidentatus]